MPAQVSAVHVLPWSSAHICLSDACLRRKHSPDLMMTTVVCRQEPKDPYLVITDGEKYLRPGVRKRPGDR